MGHMSHALELARRAEGRVSPNPPVGAVLVKDGEIVGRGYTQPPGRSHAEVVALREAGDAARGAALYTTLEPCSHQGRTPPCTDAIIEAGVAAVHAAMLDPNPNVRGGGMAILAEAGLGIRLGEGEAKARLLLEAYAKYVTTGTPFVTAKFAMSLDGKIATRIGDSKWISGEKARRRVHRLRAASDAVMVGINTVLADDPQLTARDKRGEPLERQPLRVVVDTRGRTPPGARMMVEPGRTLVAAGDIDQGPAEALRSAGAEVVSLPGDGPSVDLTALMDHLASEHGVTSLLVEGGATILGSLFDLGLVDKVVAFVSPVIVGGVTAPTPVAGAGFERIADTLRLERVRWDRYGRDMAITGYC